MGSVHDEEPDCCTSRNCCCNKCEDNFLFGNPCCMKLRKSGTSRIAFGAFAGFILGLIISATASPQRPEPNYCKDLSGKEWYPPDGKNCNYLFETTDANLIAYTKGIHMQRRFTMCANAKTLKYNLAPFNQTCGNQVSLIIDTYTGKETVVCFGQKGNETTVYGQYNDDMECTKFKKTFKKVKKKFRSTEWKLWTSFLKKSLSKQENPSSGLNYCVQRDNSSQFSYLVPTKGTSCSKGLYLQSLKETRKNSMNAQTKYEKDDKIFKDVINYLFNVCGRIWLRALILIVMPLLAANIITSVAQLRETSESGSLKLAWMTALYYVGTTVCSAIESLVLVNVMIIPFLKPIEDKHLSSYTKPSQTYVDTGAQIKSVFEQIVPANIAERTMKGGFLSLIVFSMVLGTVVGLNSKFLQFFSDLNTMMLRMIRILILWTPLGVFLMVTYAISYHDLVHVARNVGLFLSTVFLGLMIHLIIVYPLIYFTLTRNNPLTLLKNIFPAMLMALSISSSIATYPFTLSCAVNKNKFNKDISKFVLTLGATVNMDGTTIGFPIAVVFVAYAQGYTLNFGEQMLIVILSTVSSMGAAPVPQAGLVLLIVIIESLGVPLGSIFTLIVAVDWLYDRPETMVNICGDSFAAGIMHHYLHEEFEEGEKRKNTQLQEGVSS